MDELSRRGLLRGLIAVPALRALALEYGQTATLAMHPGGRFVYVANDIAEHAGLPRGTVEVYAVSAWSGTLTRIGTQPLALSATRPRGIAIAPDGSYLIVAAYGGGSYNVLPIDREGKLGKVSAIRKEVGAGPHPEHQCSAHPHSVIFDTAGRHVISSDLGCDWVSVWRVDQSKIVRVSRISLAPGAGPGALSLHANGKLLDVVHELDGAVSTHPYDPDTGKLGDVHRVFHLNWPRSEFYNYFD